MKGSKWGKKQWAAVGLVGVLGVAVYLNYYLTKEPLLQAGGELPIEEAVSSGEPLGEADFVAENTGEDGNGEAVATATEVSADYFAKARASRTAARDEAVRTVKEILGNEEISNTEKDEATQKASAIAENILQETTIENLVIAKGFSDCVAFIEDNHCSIVVEADQLQGAESVQILEIVLANSSVPSENILITSKSE